MEICIFMTISNSPPRIPQNTDSNKKNQSSERSPPKTIPCVDGNRLRTRKREQTCLEIRRDRREERVEQLRARRGFAINEALIQKPLPQACRQPAQSSILRLVASSIPAASPTPLMAPQSVRPCVLLLRQPPQDAEPRIQNPMDVEEKEIERQEETIESEDRKPQGRAKTIIKYWNTCREKLYKEILRPVLGTEEGALFLNEARDTIDQYTKEALSKLHNNQASIEPSEVELYLKHLTTKVNGLMQQAEEKVKRILAG